MARHDVFRSPAGDYLLDCQADLLRDLNTRFCVPLMPPGEAPIAGKRLNPSFRLADGTEFVMVTQFASAIPTRELGSRVHSLAAEHDAITNALDMLITGV